MPPIRHTPPRTRQEPYCNGGEAQTGEHKAFASRLSFPFPKDVSLDNILSYYASIRETEVSRHAMHRTHN